MSRFRVRYQTIEFGDEDIHVRSLRDTQEWNDDDGHAERLAISSAQWSLFGVLWDSAHVLAHLMARYAIDGRRVLEVGSGLGLASLVLNRRRADITATDYHPDAGAFMAENTKLNDDPPIPFHRVSWADAPDARLAQFDLLIASDVLYEPGQAKPFAAFLLRHAKAECEIILVDANRGHRRDLDRALSDAQFVQDELEIRATDYPGDQFRGRTHRYRRSALAPT
jgi:predicted nicotinamide N-methyase